MTAARRAAVSAGMPTSASPYPRILVAIDGSRSSQHAGRWASDIARLGRAHATVLHVSQPMGVLPNARGREPPAETLQRAIERTLALFRGVDVPAERLVTQGDVRTEIVRAALLGRADLVCLGARGRTPLRRAPLGRVAATVKERVGSSVLLARGAPPAKRILAATDGSPESRRALEVAVWLAERWSVPLDVLHVVSGDIADAQLPLATHHADVEPFLRSTAEIRSLLASGEPAEQIVAKAKDGGANLIVLGGRGTGGERTQGQVAERVLRTSPVSVLIVKASPG